MLSLKISSSSCGGTNFLLSAPGWLADESEYIRISEKHQELKGIGHGPGPTSGLLKNSGVDLKATSDRVLKWHVQ